MSKKSKRAKLIKPMKQLQQKPSIPPPPIDAQTLSRIQLAKQQLLKRKYADCISTGEPLLDSLPESSPVRVELLALLGKAHGMLKHYRQSYELFSQAISLDPTVAQLWYNRGLACHYITCPAEAVLNFERALELSKNETSETVLEIVRQLEKDRQDLRAGMETHEAGITFETYLEREKLFTQALNLTRQEKWPEAELLFRQLTETGARVPQYWGNLAVCLMMQNRYDEAEVALKQALAISPHYPIARDNLRKLQKQRRSEKPLGHTIVNPYREKKVKPFLDIFKKD